MNQTVKSFDCFLSIVYPPRKVSLRSDKGFVWKLAKWLGIRIAYVFYYLNFSANIIDAIGLAMALFGFVFILRARHNEVLLPLLGILLVYLHILLDFIDGSVARARNESSPIGHEYDEIGCELDRLILFVLFGIFSNSHIIIIMNVFSVCMVFHFIQPSWRVIPDIGFLRAVKRIYLSPLSINSVRVMLASMITLLGVIIYFHGPLEIVARVISVFYFVSIVFWVVLSLLVKECEN